MSESRFIDPRVCAMLDDRILPTLQHGASWWQSKDKKHSLAMPSIYVIHGRPEAHMHEAVVQHVMTTKGWEDIRVDGYVTRRRAKWYIKFADEQLVVADKFERKDRVPLIFMKDAREFLADMSGLREAFAGMVVLIFNTVPIGAPMSALWGALADDQEEFGAPDKEMQKRAFANAFSALREQHFPETPHITLSETDCEELVKHADHCHQSEIREFCTNVVREARFAKVKEINLEFITSNLLHNLDISRGGPSITSRMCRQEQQQYSRDRFQPRRYKKVKLSQ